MTGEEEDSRDLASFGWRREGEKCFGLVRTFIPDNFCDLLILLRYPDILTHTWHVSGAKQRIHASILTLADKRLSFLLRSSCWIELRCNIYTSLKQTLSRKPGLDVPRIVCTLQWPMGVINDHMNNCDHVVHSDLCEYTVTWTMNYVFPTAPLSIVTHLTWKFFPVVFAAEEYIWSVGIWCQMLMHGMAERSSSGPLWMDALNWSYWKGRKEST